MKPSETRKWIANTTVLMTMPTRTASHNFPIILGDSEADAARTAANLAAQMFYRRNDVQSGFLVEIEPHKFVATIGTYDNGVTQGHSVTITLTERGED